MSKKTRNIWQVEVDLYNADEALSSMRENVSKNMKQRVQDIRDMLSEIYKEEIVREEIER